MSDTTATHWLPKGLDTDCYNDDPPTTPEEAAKIAVGDVYEDWAEIFDDERDELLRDDSAEITVVGYVSTTEILDPASCDWEYTPGDEWWKPTGETRRVRLEIRATVVEDEE